MQALRSAAKAAANQAFRPETDTAKTVLFRRWRRFQPAYVLPEKLPDRRPRPLILLVSESPVPSSKHCYQPVRHSRCIQRLMETHGLLVRNKCVFVAMDGNNWRIASVYVIDR